MWASWAPGLAGRRPRRAARGEAPRETVTRLLAEVGEGRRKSFDRLFPLVYGELRALARRVRRSDEGRDPPLDTTSLVHEAYLRLVDQSRADWRSRGHFNAVASKAMRHILIDHARRHAYAKRGGGAQQISLDEAAAVVFDRQFVARHDGSPILLALAFWLPFCHC